MTATNPHIVTTRRDRFGVATPGHRPQRRPNEPDPAAAPTKKRKRRILIAVLVVVVLVAIAAAFWGGRKTSPKPPGTSDVAALRVELAAGSVLSASDLHLVTVNTTTRPKVLSAAQAAALVGERASQTLPAGTLLTAADVTTRVFPTADEAVVGLSLTPAETPAGGLVAGDAVGVIEVPSANQPPYPAPIPLAEVSVWSTGTNSNGLSVALLVPTGLATTLSTLAAHDEITLVRVKPGAAGWPAATPTTTAPTTTTTVPAKEPATPPKTTKK